MTALYDATVRLEAVDYIYRNAGGAPVSDFLKMLLDRLATCSAIGPCMFVFARAVGDQAGGLENSLCVPNAGSTPLMELRVQRPFRPWRKLLMNAFKVRSA